MKKLDWLAYKYGVSFSKHGRKALAFLLFSAVSVAAVFTALGYGASQRRFSGERLS